MTNPATSIDAATPKVWLKAQHRHSRRWVGISIALASASGLLPIVQAWLLALTVNAAVLEQAGLGQIAPWLWMILGLFALGALPGWASEQAAFRAAIRVKIHTRDTLPRHLIALVRSGLAGNAPES